MRLREMVWTLERSLRGLKVRKQQTRHGFVMVRAIPALREALEVASQFEPLRESALQALGHLVFTSAYSQTELQEKDANALDAAVGSVISRARIAKDLMEQLLPMEDPAAFAYQLPNVDGLTLKALSDRITSLEQLFEHPIKALSKAEVRVRGFESGSSVVELVVVAEQVADSAKVGAAVWVGLKVVSVIYSGAKALLLLRNQLRVEGEVHRELKLKNDMLENRKNYEVAVLEAKLESLAGSAVGQFEPNIENPHKVVEKSMKMLADELQKGARLQFSSNVDRSVAEIADDSTLAPAAAQQFSDSGSELKQLPAKDDDSFDSE